MFLLARPDCCFLKSVFDLIFFCLHEIELNMKCSPSKLLTLKIYTETDQNEKEKLNCEYCWIGSTFPLPRNPQTTTKTKHFLQIELFKALGIGPIHANRGGRAGRAGRLETPNVSFACTRRLNQTNSDCK